MKNYAGALKARYVIFIATVVLTIVATQAVIQYDLNRQNADAHLINIAGRQRMMSQRISKLTLYLYYDIKETGAPRMHRADTLRKLIDDWSRVHYNLIKTNEDNYGSKRTLALLKKNTPVLEKIVAACRSIIDKPDSSLVDKAVSQVTSQELPYLRLMEKTVDSYQKEAEAKLYYLKKIEIVLAVVSILILSLEFIYIFLPILYRLQANNTRLSALNRKLNEANTELTTSEEEIRTNMEQISLLRTNLEVREKQYRELVEDATDMIYELNEEGKFSFVNHVMETLTSYKKEDIIGRNYWDLIHEDDKQRVVQFYNQQRKTKQEVSYLEFRMMIANNGVVWVGQNVRMFFQDNWVYKVSVVARDVTSLKETQRKLFESEKQYRLLSENSHDVICLADMNRNFTFISNSIKEVWGYDAEEFVGKNMMEFIHPDDQARLIADSNAVRVEGKEVALSVFRVRRKNGDYIWMEAHARPIYDADGNVVQVQSSLRDVTQRKEAEDKLAQTQNLYKLLSENTQDLVSLFTVEGKYIFISPSVKEMLGYEPEELIGRSAIDTVHPDDLHFQMTQQRDRALRGEKFLNPPLRLKRKDGDFIWVETSTTPVVDEQGNISYILTASRNITERKQFEQALLEAKERAEQATMAKSHFLSMMSHEIRTPLNAIIGLTNLLMDDNPKDNQAERFNLLKFSGENLLTIINDILDFSKIEADKIQIEEIDFDLEYLMTRTVGMMEHRAASKGIKIVYHYDTLLPRYVKGDPVRIGQIINNLISNAIKFTEEGQVKLMIDMVKKDDNETVFLFSVLDTGIGIPPEKIETIFESFSQADGATTRKFGGTGLGLTISRKLLNLMGSEIEVESTPGYGSRFYFTLALPNGDGKNAEETRPADLTLLLKDRKLKILLVEDNEINQLVAINFLHNWGIEVRIANNGKEAVELIKEKIFDLVLMDLQMPEMNGYEATEVIRAMSDEYFRTVPIIALTASAMVEMRGKVIAMGMTDYMTKPFHPIDLQRAIGKYVLHTKE